MITANEVKIIASLFTVLICISSNAFSQTDNDLEQQAQNLQEHLKNDYFSFGLLLQSKADFQPERDYGHNGFKASKARFKILGEFDHRFGYNLQATMLKKPSVLDANVYFKPSSTVKLKAGVFKSPFSHEYATGAGSILFASRSTVVDQLGTKRQVGVQLDTYTSKKTFRFTGGIFNGNNFNSNQNSDDKFLYIGRAESYLTNDHHNKVKLGTSIAHEAKDAAGHGNLSSDYVGKQTSVTAYTSIKKNKLLLDGEFIQGWRNPDVGPESNPYGYYVTAGYYVTSKSQLLVRWDALEGDNLTQDTEQIFVGFNHKPNSFAKLKLTYVLPTDHSIEYSNFFAVLQLKF